MWWVCCIGRRGGGCYSGKFVGKAVQALTGIDGLDMVADAVHVFG